MVFGMKLFLSGTDCCTCALHDSLSQRLGSCVLVTGLVSILIMYVSETGESMCGLQDGLSLCFTGQSVPLAGG